MSAARPPLITALRLAYSDTLDALRAMPNLAVAGLLILIGASAVSVLVVHPVIPATSLLGREIMGVLTNFLLTPFLIAVHRFIVLGDVTRRYLIEPQDPRFQLFFYWSAALYIVSALAEAVVEFTVDSQGARTAVGFVVSIAMLVVSLRMTVLFPAIAVDAPGATWRNAWEDTRGHAGYLFGLVLAAILPVVFVTGILLRVKTVSPSAFVSFLVLVIGAAGLVVALTLLVTIASRFYLAMGTRVNQTPDAGAAQG
jgi:hypothetical protein